MATTSETLYIGNATKQTHDFYYRVAKDGPLRNVSLPHGTQARIPGDLSPVMVDHIVRQHAKYGIVGADEIDRSKGFHGLCYSIGKPISGLRLTLLMQQNHDALVQMGRDIREASAVAQSNMLEKVLEENGRAERLTELDMTFQQETADPKSPDPQFSEGFKVIRGGRDAPTPPKKGRRRAA